MIGKTIAHYKILEKLGQGGMGVVYRAEDTKLKRTVALKFLPPELTRDAEAKERFIQEAQAASGLDHSNICTIHQIDETDDGRMFICMACYEGETLKEKIARGPLDLDEAARIATQIAEGLSKAHKRGIVHRDIKPANIFITENDQVKIVDFGLAKLTGQVGLTKTGTTVGTVAYMSPEQGRGDDVDQRTDIWSLGVVLYEMLTGRLPFKGDHEQAVIYSIVNDEPEPIGQLRRNVPDGMQRVVAKAIRKNRNDRFSNLSEFIAELRVAAREPRAAEGHREGRSRWRMFFPYVVLAVAFVLVLISFNRFFRSEKTQHRPPLYKQVTFLGEVHFPALSPDGSHLAYITRKDDGALGIWVKDLGTDSAIEIYSAPRCWIDSWSPDGSRLLFGAIHSDVDMGTYVIPRLGGEPQKVLDHPWPSSAWSPDGEQIAHLHVGVNEITIIDLRTGETRALPLSFDTGQPGDVGALDWSPTHDLLLFQVDDTKHQSFWTIKPDGTEQALLMKTEYDPKGLILNMLWSPEGDAVYYLRFSVRGQSVMDLMKIPVDTKTGTKAGDPVMVLSGLHTGEPSFSVSEDGTRFLYAQETQYSNIWMMTVDGKEGALDVKKTQLTTGETWKSRAEISPDGSRIVFGMSSGEAMNIYSMTLPETADESETIGQPQQLTFFNSLSDYPAWSPDGSEIAFCSAQGGIPRVWHMSSGGGPPKPFENTEYESYVSDYLAWAPGRKIIHRTVGIRNFNIFDPATGACSPLVEADSLGYIFGPCWSPDGERVAFFWKREGETPPMGTWVKDMNDGSMWRIANTVVDAIGWTSDSEWIWAMQYDMTAGWHNEVFKIPVEGGEPVSWVKLPFEKMDADGVSMTPDGRKFTYSKAERHADAWIIENFDPDVE